MHLIFTILAIRYFRFYGALSIIPQTFHGPTHKAIAFTNCMILPKVPLQKISFGSSCILLAGPVIGKGSVIAAGAVVTAGLYPDDVLLAGVPAKVVKTYPRS